MSSDANGLQSPSPTSNVRLVMTLRLPTARLGAVCILLSAAVLASVGCGNPNKPAAGFAITYDTLTAYSLATADPTQPTAFYIAQSVLVVPDGTLNFDFAFNVEGGNVVIYPAKLVVTASGIPRVVGLQIIQNVLFDQIDIASHNGYEFNDSLLVAPGQIFEVVTQDTQACTALSITSQELLYGKFQIDSIDRTTGLIHFRAVVDPNCDYDTLVPGAIPSH
jgi:hypothetical protein